MFISPFPPPHRPLPVVNNGRQASRHLHFWEGCLPTIPPMMDGLHSLEREAKLPFYSLGAPFYKVSIGIDVEPFSRTSTLVEIGVTLKTIISWRWFKDLSKHIFWQQNSLLDLGHNGFHHCNLFFFCFVYIAFNNRVLQRGQNLLHIRWWPHMERSQRNLEEVWAWQRCGAVGRPWNR